MLKKMQSLSPGDEYKLGQNKEVKLHLEGTKPLPPITAKVGPFPTHAAVHPVTRCTTVAINRDERVRKVIAIGFTYRKKRDNDCLLRQGGKGEERETYYTTGSILLQHHHEPAHTLKDKFHNVSSTCYQLPI